MATGKTVVVAFSANNIKPTIENIRNQFPAINIAIAADDDWKTRGNPGNWLIISGAQKYIITERVFRKKYRKINDER